MSIHVGYRDAGTGWTPVIDDFPFVPEAAIFWAMDQSADSLYFEWNGGYGDNTASYGMASRDGNQMEVSVSDQGDPSNPLETLKRRNYPGRATATGRVLGLARGSLTPSIPGKTIAISSWDSCGWHLAGGGGSAWRFYYVVFGGVTLKAAARNINLPSDGSNGVLTGLPFNPLANPTGVFVLGSKGTAGADTGFHCIGFFDGSNSYAVSLNAGYVQLPAATVAASGVVLTDDVGYTLTPTLTTDGLILVQSGGLGISSSACVLILSDEAGEFNVDVNSWGGASLATAAKAEGALFVSGYTRDTGSNTSGQVSFGAASPDSSGSGTIGEGGGFSTDYLRWGAQETNAQVLETWFPHVSAAVPESTIDVTAFNPSSVSVAQSGAGLATNFGSFTIKLSKASFTPCGFVPQIYRVIQL